MDQQQHAVQRLSDLHLATVEALALAIDAADQGSRLHLRRLQRHASLLARACSLGDDEVQAVATGAMLHDIGMLAVPQHILAKRDGLTDDERRKLWLHPQVGADIIHAVPFPSPVAPLILSHHEQWDGGGYPAGLLGEAIPLGSRIIALVDRFDIAAARAGGDAAGGAGSSRRGRRTRPRSRSRGPLPGDEPGRPRDRGRARAAARRRARRARHLRRAIAVAQPGRAHRARAARGLRPLRSVAGARRHAHRHRRHASAARAARRAGAVLDLRAVPARQRVGADDVPLDGRARRGRPRDHDRQRVRAGAGRLGPRTQPFARHGAAGRRCRHGAATACRRGRPASSRC